MVFKSPGDPGWESGAGNRGWAARYPLIGWMVLGIRAQNEGATGGIAIGQTAPAFHSPFS